MKVPQKLKIELPYGPTIALLGIYIYMKKTKTLTRKDTCTPMFTASLFTKASIWKQLKCPSMDEWVKKIRCLCIYNIYTHTYAHTQWNTTQSQKMNEILPFAATCLDLNCIMVSEKSHRRTNAVYYHLYVQSKNKWMTVSEKKQGHKYREQTSGYQWCGRSNREGDQEAQTTMSKVNKL